LRLRRGRVSEAFAAAVLLAKGYRILGRRVRTRAGEIDIVAVRGKRLAFVEVKRRLTREDAEAAVSAGRPRASAARPICGSRIARAITTTFSAST
jgi:Holliday junction resolvase-like predicted endonuclease